MPALAFFQNPKKGATVIVADPVSGQPHLTTITGQQFKSGEKIFFHSDGNSWTRPEDITVLQERFIILMDVARQGLQDFYPSLRESLSPELLLAVLPDYENTGSNQADYETLRDALEVQAQRLQTTIDNQVDDLESPRP